MDIFSKLNIKSNIKEERTEIKDELMKIYNKPHKDRTHKDYDILSSDLKNLSFFKKLQQENKYVELMFRTMVRRMEIKILEPGEPIYRVKEQISSMFIVLEGKVVVYKKPKEYKLKQNQKYETKKLRFIEKIVWSFKNSISAQVNKVPDYFLYKGDEYGLNDIKKNKREVLVETRSNCVIGEISRADYILIFEKTEFLEKNDVLYFLSGMKVFDKYANSALLSNLYDVIKRKTAFKGEYLCKRGEPFDKIIIIRNGNFQVFFNSNVKMRTIYDLSSFEDKNNKEFCSGSAYNINFELKGNYNEKYQYKIVELGTGEMIGDIEYVNNSKKFLFNILCVADNSQILEISYKDFYNFATQGLNKKIRKISIEKLKSFQKRIEEIRIVNKKSEIKQNKYRDLIIKKINNSKGLILDKMEQPIQLSQLENTKKKILFKIRRKDTTFTKDNMNDENFYLNSSNNKRNFSPNELPSVEKYDTLHTEPPIKVLKFYGPKLKYRTISPPVKLLLNSQVPANTISTRETQRNIKKHTIMLEDNKKNFPSCFEVNKDFFLKNNTSIIRNDLKNIFHNFN